jgi:NADH-quinone oxidoreductase subunit L
MGGLRRQLPLVFWTFLAGAASLSALPLVTAGFYSKEWILASVWSSGRGGACLWAAGLAGAFLTVIYTFRMVFIVFCGREGAPVSRRPGLSMKIPLVVLAIFSLVAGFLETPRMLGNLPAFSGFLRSVLPDSAPLQKNLTQEIVLALISAAVVLMGLYLAYLLFLKKDAITDRTEETGPRGTIGRFLLSGWGFDRLYDLALVRPLNWLARVNKNDALDFPFQGLARAVSGAHRILGKTQTGRLGWYAAAMVLGAIIVLAVAVFL